MLSLLLIISTSLSIFEGEKWQSGAIPVNQYGDIAYLFFQARNHDEHAPILLWLTGGPGCSSMVAALEENGPYDLQKDLSLKFNPNAWNNIYNVLYIDQPSGVGFSYNSGKSMCNDSFCSARDIAIFLTKFVMSNPQYTGRDFYITGESYAGHYIPVLAELLLKANYSLLNFKGVAIGNGWYDPIHQIKSYPKFTYENDLINFFQFVYTYGCEMIAQMLLPLNGTWGSTVSDYCEGIMIGDPEKFSVYDIRKHGGENEALWVNFFFNNEDNRKSIGMNRQYQGFCSEEVSQHFKDEFMVSISNDFLYVLNSGLPTLIYTGNKDFICNWVSTEMFLRSLGTKYNDIGNYTEYINKDTGKVMGSYKKYKNLIYMVVNDAGHMVPSNQPENSLYMLESFISGKM